MPLDVPDDDIFGRCRTLAEAQAVLDQLFADLEAKITAEAVENVANCGGDASELIALHRGGFAYAREKLRCALAESGCWVSEGIH